MDDLHVYIIAGEPSGDAIGAPIMKAIRDRLGARVRFSGIGGTAMVGEGLEPFFPMIELSIMGVAEVLPSIPRLLRRIHETVQDIGEKKPDILLTLDAPDFCFRVAGRVKKRGHSVKIIHCVAPTVWAWRPGRAKKIARFLDHILCLFDFEPPYFEKEGLPATFIGHPLVQSGVFNGNGDAFRQRHGIPKVSSTVGGFFGSRGGEIKRVGPVLKDVMGRMGRVPFIIPTLPHLHARITRMLKDTGVKAVVTSDAAEKWDAFAACDCAVAVSGTVGLELAAAGVPHVIAYRIGTLTHQIVKRLIRVRHAHLANIMMGAPMVPEFIQGDCTAEKIVPALSSLLKDEVARNRQKALFVMVRHKIGARSSETPAQRAASVILSVAGWRDRETPQSPADTHPS